MATIDQFGGSTDPLSNPAFGGPTGWAAAVRDAIAATYGTHPNGTDLLVKTSDGVMVRYDSGWRGMSQLLENGWGSNDGDSAARIRRVNNVVYFIFDMSSTSATAQQWLTLPEGFKGYQYTLQAFAAHDAISGVLYSGDVTGAMRTSVAQPSIPVFRSSGNFFTDDPIPAALPGNPVGPNPA